MTAVSGLRAEYPGDTIRIALLICGDEIGDVRIQDYGSTISRNRYRVGAFLPGETECPSGDTSKTWPDHYEWCADPEAANVIFDRLLIAARRAGWKDYNRETGKAA